MYVYIYIYLHMYVYVYIYIFVLGDDKGGQLEFFRGACATRQCGDGGIRFSLGPLKAEGKR